MHALYLPLHRVARVVQGLKAGVAIPRGTLRTTFWYESFPECYRLGVPTDFVQEHILSVKQPADGTFHQQQPGGMLKVKSCIPGSPAEAVLQPGDVVLRVSGAPC